MQVLFRSIILHKYIFNNYFTILPNFPVSHLMFKNHIYYFGEKNDEKNGL